jgi:hypothetical protein
MKKRVLFLAFLIIPWMQTILAQKAITLKECYEQAMSANALAGEKEAYSGISALKDKNL